MSDLRLRGDGPGDAEAVPDRHERAGALGFDRLVLDTTSTQTAAIGLFEASGDTGSHRVDVDAGETVRIFENGV